MSAARAACPSTAAQQGPVHPTLWSIAATQSAVALLSAAAVRLDPHTHTPARPLPPPPPACDRSTFFRVWAFLVLEFQLMAVLLWGWGNFYALTSVCLTHAALSLLEQLAGAWTQRAPSAWGRAGLGRGGRGGRGRHSRHRAHGALCGRVAGKDGLCRQSACREEAPCSCLLA